MKEDLADPNEDTSVDRMTADASKPMHIAWAFLLSLPLAGLGSIFTETSGWTDRLMGFQSGLFHMLLFGLFWPIYMIPWCLIVFFCYRKRLSQRNRTLWVLGPSILVLLFTIGGLIFQPPTPGGRFKATTGATMPMPTTDLKVYFSGGGLADISDTYYFRTPTSEIERIVQELKLEVDYSFDPQAASWPLQPEPSGFPDYRTWPGVKCFRGSRENGHWFYSLITDSEKTQAYIFAGCT